MNAGLFLLILFVRYGNMADKVPLGWYCLVELGGGQKRRNNPNAPGELPSPAGPAPTYDNSIFKNGAAMEYEMRTLSSNPMHEEGKKLEKNKEGDNRHIYCELLVEVITRNQIGKIKGEKERRKKNSADEILQEVEKKRREWRT